MLASSLAQAQGESKESKIEKILTFSKADAMLNQMFDQVKGMATSQLPRDMSFEQRAKAVEVQDKVTELLKSRLSWDKLRPIYVKLYTDTFTDEEIDGLLAFYQSPAGRAMIEMMPTLMGKSMQSMQGLMQEIMPEVERIVRETVGQ